MYSFRRKKKSEFDIGCFKIWPHRLTVRTLPSQGKNRGPIPREVTFRNLVGSKRKIWARRRRAVWRGNEIRLAGAGEFGGWAK